MADNFKITPDLALAQEQFDAIIAPAQIADYEANTAPQWAQTCRAMLNVLAQDKAALLTQLSHRGNTRTLAALINNIKHLALHLHDQQEMAHMAVYRLTVVASTVLTRQ